MIVIANNERNRIQLLVESKEVGILDYAIHENAATVMHTEVYAEFSKHGYAELLVKSFIAFAENKRYVMRAICPYAHEYFVKNNIEFEE